MTNVAVLQGAAVPDSAGVFYLQLGGLFSGAKDAKIVVSGAVAEYVSRTIESGLLCFVKGSYVPSGNHIQADSVAFLRDKAGAGEPLWE
jgi:hypothetical protein